MLANLGIMNIKGQHLWCLEIFRALAIIVASPAILSVIVTSLRTIRRPADTSSSADISSSADPGSSADTGSSADIGSSAVLRSSAEDRD